MSGGPPRWRRTLPGVVWGRRRGELERGGSAGYGSIERSEPNRVGPGRDKPRQAEAGRAEPTSAVVWPRRTAPPLAAAEPDPALPNPAACRWRPGPVSECLVLDNRASRSAPRGHACVVRRVCRARRNARTTRRSQAEPGDSRGALTRGLPATAGIPEPQPWTLEPQPWTPDYQRVPGKTIYPCLPIRIRVQTVTCDISYDV